jgi:hypothetical protein
MEGEMYGENGFDSFWRQKQWVYAAKRSSHTLGNLLATLKSRVTKQQAKKDGVKNRKTLWHTKLVYNTIKCDAHVSS